MMNKAENTKNLKKFSCIIPAELWRALKMQAAADSVTMTDIIVQALEKVLRDEFLQR